MSKILICGLNGSGKTTLGKELSKKINYVHKDVEMYYFKNNDEYKYASSITKDEVTKELEHDFQEYENIVFTACKGDYGILSDLYDFAIYINLDKETRLKRVTERSYKQFGDRILENGDLHERENKFFEMVYNKDESDILSWFTKLKCPKMQIDGRKAIEENMAIIFDKYKEIPAK